MSASTVLAQSGTQLTPSGPTGGEQAFDFRGAVIKIAAAKAKGATIARYNLNKNKLVSGVCAEYKAMFASVYSRESRLPGEIMDRITSECDKFIGEQLNAITAENSTGLRRAFAHKERDMSVVERVTSTGENTLDLKRQHFGINLLIGQAEERLKNLQKFNSSPGRNNPNFDLEKDLQMKLVKLGATKAFIEASMAAIKDVSIPKS